MVPWCACSGAAKGREEVEEVDMGSGAGFDVAWDQGDAEAVGANRRTGLGRVLGLSVSM